MERGYEEKEEEEERSQNCVASGCLTSCLCPRSVMNATKGLLWYDSVSPPIIVLSRIPGGNGLAAAATEAAATETEDNGKYDALD